MAANDSAAKSPETTHGFSNEGLAEFNAKLHALVDGGKLASIVTLIAHHGEIVNCDAYGVHDTSATPPVLVKTDSIFRIMSMTKPITSAAMLMLWEEGKWALDDPVAKFIPEFEGLKVRQPDGEPIPQASPMTMKQLICHSAGFGARGDYPELRGGDLQDMIDILAQQPLFHQPGSAWRYGPSVDIMGYIIQKLTGQSLDEFLEQRVFAPLGMVDTGYTLPASKMERLVSNHEYDADHKLVAVDLAGSYNTSRPKFLGGGGGLMLSTVRDYWRFSQMILNGGEFEGKRYLKQSTVDMMHAHALEPGVKVNLRGHYYDGIGFGLGYAIVQDPVEAKSSLKAETYWWGGLLGTWFWIDPVNDLVVIGFVNHAHLATGFAARELSIRLVYKAINGN